jgi:hypothetical protein
VHTEHYAPLFDRICYALLFLIGIVFTVGGFGLSITKLFRKAFIIIDHERISIKAKASFKEQKVLWDDIKSINYNLSGYLRV